MGANLGALLQQLHILAGLSLLGRHELDGAVALLLVIPIDQTDGPLACLLNHSTFPSNAA